MKRVKDSAGPEYDCWISSRLPDTPHELDMISSGGGGGGGGGGLSKNERNFVGGYMSQRYEALHGVG